MTTVRGRTGRGALAPVIVGVDGSPSALSAVDWAATEASAMGRPLHIVHGLGVTLGPTLGGPGDSGVEAAAERLLTQAENRARATTRDVKITSELVVAAPAPALLGQAQEAELLVVGSRGLGGFTGLLVGSVGVAVAAHAPCPVVVVRPPEDADRSSGEHAGRVVVGVDGSELSAAAIRFAFEVAARRGVGVTAVHSWAVPIPVHPSLVIPVDNLEEVEHRLLEESLQDEQQRFPDVDVVAKLVHASPAHALMVESGEAQLVVVGSRGHGGFAGMLLGSVSQAVLQHADCPVAVIRPHTDPP